jgi:hypothetical protein
MRNPERITSMLDALRLVWEQNPDWRLGQLISNVVQTRYRGQETDLFFVEDGLMEKALLTQLRYDERRNGNDPRG